MIADDYTTTQSRLRQALATHDEDYLKRNCPGAWPWPVSGGQMQAHPAQSHAQQRPDMAAVPDLDEAGMPMLVEGERK